MEKINKFFILKQEYNDINKSCQKILGIKKKMIDHLLRVIRLFGFNEYKVWNINHSSQEYHLVYSSVLCK